MLPLQFAAIFNPKENGECQHLIKDDNGQYACDIHDTRPLICNVAWSIKNRSAMLGLSEEAMLELTENACEVLNNDNISKKI